MRHQTSIYNKVNFISLSRIFLTIIAVLLIATGEIKLLIIAYAIMGFSEVSDVVDGYVARRDHLVTDLGKILDPLSDSISRFFYFFVLSFHGLFPIWFMIFFFFRDIIVAYVRIYASFSGKVLSARFSGKLKGACQFGGQYLLMTSLIVNTLYEGQKVSDTFIYSTVIISLIIYFMMLFYFKIKGKLLYIVLFLSFILALILIGIKNCDFRVSYLLTFSFAFITLAVTIYSLVDYLLSLRKKTSILLKTFLTSSMIIFMFLISPYFIDYFKNKFGTNIKNLSWQTQVLKLNNKVKTLVTNDSLLVIASNDDKLLFYQKDENKLEKICSVDLTQENLKVRALSIRGEFLFILDDKHNKILKNKIENIIKKQKIFPEKNCSMGINFSGAMTVAQLFGNSYLAFNDYLLDRKLYFISLNKKDDSSDQKYIDLSITSEFYVKDLTFERGKLFILTGKQGNDLIYEVDCHKAISEGCVQAGITNIYSVGNKEYQGLSILKNNFFSYDNKNNNLQMARF